MRSRVLDEISSLDPERDHQRIAFLSCRVDFPWDTTRALEFALFRTFAAPSIAALLHKTQEFECRSQKRYDDTDIIVSEIMEHGYDSDRGRAAIARMNALHGRFHIPNRDFLYVLSTFIFEPIRWNQRFGWRRNGVKLPSPRDRGAGGGGAATDTPLSHHDSTFVAEKPSQKSKNFHPKGVHR
jgi:hypothetical protein